MHRGGVQYQACAHARIQAIATVNTIDSQAEALNCDSNSDASDPLISDIIDVATSSDEGENELVEDDNAIVADPSPGNSTGDSGIATGTRTPIADDVVTALNTSTNHTAPKVAAIPGQSTQPGPTSRIKATGENRLDWSGHIRLSQALQ